MIFTILTSEASNSSNLLLGDTDIQWFSYDVNTFDQSRLEKYNAFTLVVGNYLYINIINSPYTLTLTRVISETVNNNSIEIDFELLSEEDKLVIKSFYDSIVNNL